MKTSRHGHQRGGETGQPPSSNIHGFFAAAAAPMAERLDIFSAVPTVYTYLCTEYIYIMCAGVV